MSALGGTAAGRPLRTATATSGNESRPPAKWLRLGAFGGLGVYGVLRWATLLAHPPLGRLLGMAALALVQAAVLAAVASRPRRAAWRRAVAVLVVLLGVAAILPLAGVPLGWLLQARAASITHAVSDGLSTLPQVLVPYDGLDAWVRMVILVGPGLVLVAAATLLAWPSQAGAKGPLSGVRLGAVVTLLLLLPGFSAALLAPRLPLLQGLLLFALLAVLVWAERLRIRTLPATAALIGLCAGAAIVAAPTVELRHPWIDVQTLAGRVGAGAIERFEFAQSLGPLRWPRTGREIFEVRAQRGDFWKAQNLDLFDGRGFVPPISSAESLPAPDAVQQARFTQTIAVTIRGLESSEVITAGYAALPATAARPVQPAVSPGTWTAVSALEPGDSYTVRTYSPSPSAAALAGDDGSYPSDVLAAYRSMLLPSLSAPGATTPIVFPPFHGAVTPALESSPYARTYRLARQLAAGAATPYAFVQAVLARLRHGLRYDERPPVRPFPLESFLFVDHRGHCQQFSGAMALLLRMGGIPARVAGGFTTGVPDRSAHRWVVSDLDAHDWVEVWFPHFGWVRFDPTPATSPARGRQLPPQATREQPTPRLSPRGPGRHPVPATRTGRPHPRAATGVSRSRGDGGTWLPVAGVTVVALLGLCLAAAAARRTRRVAQDHEVLTAELARALRRCGRPAAPQLTLAALEQGLRFEEAAAAYVRSLRLARFGRGAEGPTVGQRRALRAHLRQGLGLAGWLRALWALPPRPMARRGHPWREPPH